MNKLIPNKDLVKHVIKGDIQVTATEDDRFFITDAVTYIYISEEGIILKSVSANGTEAGIMRIDGPIELPYNFMLVGFAPQVSLE